MAGDAHQSKEYKTFSRSLEEEKKLCIWTLTMNLDCSTPPATWTRSRQKNLIWKVATKIVLVVQTHVGTGPPEGEMKLFSTKSPEFLF